MLTELRYRRALASSGLWRGESPAMPVIPSRLSFRETLLVGLIIGSVAAGITYLVAQWLHVNDRYGQLAMDVGGWAMALFIVWPFVKVFWYALRRWQRPDFTRLHHFSFAQRTLANIAVALCLTLSLQSASPWLQNAWQTHISPQKHHLSSDKNNKITTHKKKARTHNKHSTKKRTKTWQPSTLFGIWLFLSISLMVGTHWLSHRTPTPKSRQRFRKSKAKKLKNHLPLGVWVGESTGWLAALSHQASIAAKQQVGLFYDDLAQNVLVLGGIGSGKTTRAVHPFLVQLLDQECGGLIFDIKGDFHKAVAHFAKLTQRTYRLLGPNHESLNLLSGLSPEMAASFLKSAFLLSGSRIESFWIDTATELSRNVLGILAFLPEHYTLQGLYCYVFDRDWRKERLHEIERLSVTWEEAQLRLVRSYQHYVNHIFEAFDDKVKAGVRATLSQVLSPFNHPDLIDAFCTASNNSATLEDVLNGEVFLIQLPLSHWGLGGKVAYTLIKLRFFNVMQSRTIQTHWDQERYVFFLCDEYQEIVSASKDGLSDLNFWDKSRSSKTIGIISAQSISSFYAQLDDRDLTHALLQNFRQKMCFRTEDQNTIDFINKLLGKVEVTRTTVGQSEGDTTGWKNRSSHTGVSSSFTTVEKYLLDGQFFRTLDGNYALAILSLGGMGFDDVVRMQAFYV